MINEVGIRATLDIGDAVASAGRLADSLNGIGKAMPSALVGADTTGFDQFTQKGKELKGIIDSIANTDIGDSLSHGMNVPVQRSASSSLHNDQFAQKFSVEQTRAEFAAKLAHGQSMPEEEMQRALNDRVKELYSSITKTFDKPIEKGPSLFDNAQSTQVKQPDLAKDEFSFIDEEPDFNQGSIKPSNPELFDEGTKAEEKSRTSLGESIQKQAEIPKIEPVDIPEPESVKVLQAVEVDYSLKQAEIPKIEPVDIPEPESVKVLQAVEVDYSLKQAKIPDLTPDKFPDRNAVKIPQPMELEIAEPPAMSRNLAEPVEEKSNYPEIPASAMKRFQQEQAVPQYSLNPVPETPEKRESNTKIDSKQINPPEPRDTSLQPSESQQVPPSIILKNQEEQETARPTRGDIVRNEALQESPAGLSVATEEDLKHIFENMGTILQKAVAGGDAVSARDAARLMLRAENQSRLTRRSLQPGKDKSPNGKNKSQSSGSMLGKLFAETRRYGTALGSGRIGDVAVGAATQGPQLMSFLKTLSPAALVGGGIAATGLVAGFAGNKLSEAYEQVMQPSMKLAATLGTLTGEYSSNSKAFHSALGMASQSAVQFGYSMQDGLGVMTELARFGLNPAQSMGMSSKVFSFERGTGADRGILTQAAGMSSRYKAGDALGYAYGGTVASGMNTGQFQEYLSATLRIFEEGLSRGVVKGFGEVTRVQNFIAAIGGRGNPLWQGEQGYQRYKAMSDATVAATSLDSEYDVIAYQAMDETLKKAAAKGFKDDAEGKWSTYKQYAGGSYIDTMRALEGGLTPEYFKTVMDTVATRISNGNEKGMIEGIRKIWSNVDYSTAVTILEAYKSKSYLQAVSVIKPPLSSDSPELKLLTVQEDIKVKLAEIGESVLPIKTNIMGAVDGIFRFLAGDKLAKESTETMGATATQVMVGAGLPGNTESAVAVSNFQAAGKAALETRSTPGKQPDKDRNGVGDYADAYWDIEKMLLGYSEEQRQFLSITGRYRDLVKGKSKPEDLPGIRAAMQNPSFWKGYSAFDIYDDPNNFSTSRFNEVMDATLKKMGHKTTGKGALTFPSYLRAGIEAGHSGALDIMQGLTVASGGDLEKLFTAIPNLTRVFDESVRVAARTKSPDGEKDGVVSASEWKTIFEGIFKILSDAAGKIAGAADKFASDQPIQIVIPATR